jgi:hypothetical protein
MPKHHLFSNPDKSVSISNSFKMKKNSIHLFFVIAINARTCNCNEILQCTHIILFTTIANHRHHFFLCVVNCSFTHGFCSRMKIKRKTANNCEWKNWRTKDITMPKSQWHRDVIFFNWFCIWSINKKKICR